MADTVHSFLGITYAEIVMIVILLSQINYCALISRVQRGLIIYSFSILSTRMAKKHIIVRANAVDIYDGSFLVVLVPNLSFDF